MSKLNAAAEFWEFVRYNKKYWLAPIVLVLALVGVLGGGDAAVAEREAVARRSDSARDGARLRRRRREGREEDREDLPVESSLRRSSRIARGVGVLSVALRRSGRAYDGRRRRVGD